MPCVYVDWLLTGSCQQLVSIKDAITTKSSELPLNALAFQESVEVIITIIVIIIIIN
jgi:hypothetical protein